MKNKITFLVLLLSLMVVAKANPVDVTLAREAGFKFLNANQKMNVKNVDALRLVKTYRCETGEAAFYVFNTSTGFVIVSAENCITPILGYSYEGTFDPDNVPVQMQDYLNGFLQHIEYNMANHLVADDVIAAQWERVKTTGRIKDVRGDHEVLPLLKERWNQGCYYNEFCPKDTTSFQCNHAMTGCVATAMAQIMHYWKYPEIGQGSHSYIPSSHPEYGELSVDFSATTYDWDNMPNGLTSHSSDIEIEAVATLLYHCGVSTNMNYGPHSSGAFSSDAAYALSAYFKYSDKLFYKHLWEVGESTWFSNVKACLDSLRPVYYSGLSPSGGHAFVCDGYDRDDLLHFNWGWGGTNNGYFAMDDAGGYNGDNTAIFNIHPPINPSQTCQINVVANPSDAGMVTGGGTLHCGEMCTLTAHAFEGSNFLAWMEDNIIVSNDSVYTFLVMKDRDIVANFDTWSPTVSVTCVEDSVFAQSAVVSWADDEQGGSMTEPWPLLFSFDVITNLQSGVMTDGRFIYTSTWSSSSDDFLFHKYDPSGRLIEKFDVEGCGKLYDLAYDGSFVYGSYEDSKLYRVDLTNKRLSGVIQTECNRINGCTYDPDQDGFWICDKMNAIQKKLKFINREGHIVKEGPRVDTCTGIAYYRNPQGEPHLFLFCRDNNGEYAKVYDYDIRNDVVGHNALCDFTQSPLYVNYKAGGAFVGEFEGRAAFFGYIHNECVAIYELPMDVSEVRYHRVYRINGTVSNEGATSNLEPIADRCFGSSYVDHTWDTLPTGTYTYGVSMLRGNEESRICWAAPIEHKTSFTISANANIWEGGTVSGQGRYEEGMVCTLTATAYPDYEFVAWLRNDNVVSTEPSISFTVTENATYVACFEKTIFEIVVNVQPTIAGVVTGSGRYNKGETVTLTVTPNANYRFSRWSENGIPLSYDPIFSFAAQSDRTITAELLYNSAIDEQIEECVLLHPNPAHDQLVVICQRPISRCEIYSVAGALMYSKENPTGISLEIDLVNLSSGLYTIRLITDSGTVTKKFVKQ